MGAHAVQESRGQHITQCSQSELKLAGTQKTKPTQKSGAINHWLARDHPALRELCTQITSEFQVTFAAVEMPVSTIPVCQAQDTCRAPAGSTCSLPCCPGKEVSRAELRKWQHRGGEVKVGKEGAADVRLFPEETSPSCQAGAEGLTPAPASHVRNSPSP